jgi:hypothetical protein
VEREAANGANDARVDGFDLVKEFVLRSSDLLRERITIARWTVLEKIGEIHLSPVEASEAQEAVEFFSSGTYEWAAGLVLFDSRRFTDQHD